MFVRRQLRRPALAHRHHGELGGAIRLHARRAEHAGHGGGVDEVAALAVAVIRGREDLHAIDHAHQVDVGHPLPVAEREPCRTGRPQPTPALLQTRWTLPNLAMVSRAALLSEVAARDVGDHALGADLQRAQFGHRGGQGGRLDIGQHDLHAFAAEHLGHGQADAAGPAGDEGDLALEILHAWFLALRGVGYHHRARLRQGRHPERASDPAGPLASRRPLFLKSSAGGTPALRCAVPSRALNTSGLHRREFRTRCSPSPPPCAASSRPPPLAADAKARALQRRRQGRHLAGRRRARLRHARQHQGSGDPRHPRRQDQVHRRRRHPRAEGGHLRQVRARERPDLQAGPDQRLAGRQAGDLQRHDGHR